MNQVEIKMQITAITHKKRAQNLKPVFLRPRHLNAVDLRAAVERKNKTFAQKIKTSEKQR